MNRSILVIPLIFMLYLLLPLIAWPLEGRGKTMQPLHPPIKGKMGITGTLGEYRWSRLHHGIDISTGGKTWLPVYAVDDGYVTGLGYSRYGIGYYIRLQHSDGRSSLYGHLQGFASSVMDGPEMKRYHEEIKLRREFTASVEEEQIMVQRGEQIAYSGDSGAGFAHLHFEYRQDDRLLDPLQYGLFVPDKTPPKLLHVELIPHGDRSRINGQVAPVRLPLKLTDRGTVKKEESDQNSPKRIEHYYKVEDGAELRLSGRAILKLTFYDPSGRSRLGLARGALYLNQEQIFQIDMDSLPTEPRVRSNHIYDLEGSSIGRNTVYTQFFSERIADQFSFITGKNRGLIELDSNESTASLSVFAIDSAGNRSVAIIPLARDPGQYSKRHTRTPNAYPGERALLSSEDRLFSMEIGRRALINSTNFRIEKNVTDLPVPSGLKQVSSVYTISPDFSDFTFPYKVRLQSQPLQDRTLYYFPSGGRYVIPLGSAEWKEGYIEARARRTGSFVILSDRRRPGWRRIRKRTYHSENLRLFIYPYDIGSGIDYTRLEVTVDGKRVQTEHDADRRAAEVFYPDHFKTKGKHRLKATAYDNAGNRSKQFVYEYVVK